ncbi:MAG: DoxX family protein [Sphingobacteriales bacterium]|nr:MAG: DoxX family protein [Sphingobacteriales bacterium]
MVLFSRLGRYSDLGLLIMRLGIGAMMIVHGYPKLTGGPEKWAKIGGAIGNIGIHGNETIWGFMAAAAEGIGGLLIVLGLAFRPACFFLLFTMVVAAITHLSKGDGISGASHAIELGFVFLGLFITGPGRHSFDKK